MEKVIADLELDLREIKYLTRELSSQPDEDLIEVAKRRVRQMQSYLDNLLQEIEKMHAKSISTQEILDSIRVDLPIQPQAEDIIVTLAQQIKPTVNLKEAFTLNDTYRYTRELFGGETEYMNQVLEQMSQMENHELVCSFLASKVKISNPEENEVLDEFQEQIKKYFT